MSDDEPDHELLDLLRKSLGIDGGEAPSPPTIRVLEDAEFVKDNATVVALDMQGTKAAASKIYALMQEKGYGFQQWRAHELHPKAQDSSTVDFIFVLDLLNFSFWSSSSDSSQVFAVEYNGKIWTGYWSLVAALQRALAEDIPITTPSFWIDEERCNEDLLKNIFRSCNAEGMPMLQERIDCLREAGYVLQERFDGSFMTLLQEANNSAAALVNLLARNFACFDDTHYFEGELVRFHKRAQILVADLWACFEGDGYGHFSDIDQVTMFADYRIPQILHSLGSLSYSPLLESHIRKLRPIESGHSWELQLRGCTIWCVEQIRREIVRCHPDTHINAILIDFFLYDTLKQMGDGAGDMIPYHRTRSIWY